MPALHPMIASTLLMIALIGGVALVGERLLPPAPIELTLTAPEGVIPSAGGVAYALLSLELHNPSSRRQSVTARSSCPLEWFLTGARGEFIQAGSRKGCEAVSVTRPLEPYARAREEIRIAVKTDRLTLGRAYRLRVRYWNLTGETLLRF